MEAGSKEVGDFCYLAKSPTLLTPKEASSLRRGVRRCFEMVNEFYYGGFFLDFGS